MLRVTLFLITFYFFYSSSALHLDSKAGDTKLPLFAHMARMLTQGKQINAPDQDGLTPFMHLFYNQKSCMPAAHCEQFIKYLIDSHGADINHVDNRGRNAFYYAIHHYWQGVPLLLACGIDLHSEQTSKIFNPLEEVIVLIEKNIMYPVFSKEVTPIVKLLIREGFAVSPVFAARLMRSALDLVRNHKNSGLLHYLIDIKWSCVQKIYKDSLSKSWVRQVTSNRRHLGGSSALIYFDTPTSIMIRQRVIARNQLVMDMRSDPNSFFSRLPWDLARMVNQYYLPDGETILNKINSIPVHPMDPKSRQQD